MRTGTEAELHILVCAFMTDLRKHRLRVSVATVVFAAVLMLATMPLRPAPARAAHAGAGEATLLLAQAGPPPPGGPATGPPPRVEQGPPPPGGPPPGSPTRPNQGPGGPGLRPPPRAEQGPGQGQGQGRTLRGGRPGQPAGQFRPGVAAPPFQGQAEGPPRVVPSGPGKTARRILPVPGQAVQDGPGGGAPGQGRGQSGPGGQSGQNTLSREAVSGQNQGGQGRAGPAGQEPGGGQAQGEDRAPDASRTSSGGFTFVLMQGIKAVLGASGAGGLALVLACGAGAVFMLFSLAQYIRRFFAKAPRHAPETPGGVAAGTRDEALRKELARRQAEALRTLGKMRMVDAYWARSEKERLEKQERQAQAERRKAEERRRREAQREHKEQERRQAEELRREGEAQRRRAAERPPTGETRDAAWARKVLGVGPGASAREIKKAYIAGMKHNHPDQVSTMSEKIQAYFSERAKRINMAYDLLKNHGE